MPDPVPERFKPILRAQLLAEYGEDRDALHAGHFDSAQSVLVNYPDGSFALFKYAFALFDAKGESAMVFTEHCGYHLVSADGVQVLRGVPRVGTGG